MPPRTGRRTIVRGGSHHPSCPTTVRHPPAWRDAKVGTLMSADPAVPGSADAGPADDSAPADGVDVFELGAEHEQVVFCNDHATGLRAIVAIHSTALGPSLGGTRFYPYASTADAVQ